VINIANPITIINKFKKEKVLIIGDVMLDKYLWGTVKRISPEAPVQVVNVRKETYSAGGAANVAVNVSSLGSDAELIGMMGKDDTRQILNTLLLRKKVNTKGILIDPKKPTVQKVRVLAQNQQLIRIDYETPEYMNKKDEKKIIYYISKKIRDCTSIIISDYAKGIITKGLMRFLIGESRKRDIPIIIDPKPKHVEYYKGATLITPNHKEACLMAGIDETNGSDNILEVGKKLQEITGSNILITRGEKGMSLFKKDNQVIHISTTAKEVYDVTGAGDTVIATLALALGAGSSMELAAEIANHAAGIVVGKIGTASTNMNELKKVFI